MIHECPLEKQRAIDQSNDLLDSYLGKSRKELLEIVRASSLKLRGIKELKAKAVELH